jgi:hypothetical protein
MKTIISPPPRKKPARRPPPRMQTTKKKKNGTYSAPGNYHCKFLSFPKGTVLTEETIERKLRRVRWMFTQMVSVNGGVRVKIRCVHTDTDQETEMAEPFEQAKVFSQKLPYSLYYSPRSPPTHDLYVKVGTPAYPSS